MRMSHWIPLSQRMKRFSPSYTGVGQIRLWTIFAIRVSARRLLLELHLYKLTHFHQLHRMRNSTASEYTFKSKNGWAFLRQISHSMGGNMAAKDNFCLWFLPSQQLHQSCWRLSGVPILVTVKLTNAVAANMDWNVNLGAVNVVESAVPIHLHPPLIRTSNMHAS